MKHRYSFYCILFSFMLFAQSYAQTPVYLITSGNPLNPADWNTAIDGSGASLGDFNANCIYNFGFNDATVSLGSTWGITAGSTVNLGDGTNPFTLIYSGTADIGSTPANLVVNNNAILNLQRTYNFISSKTTFNSGSTAFYSTGSTSLGADTYHNLTIAENINTNGATVTVNGTFLLGVSRTFTIDNSGSMTFGGSVFCNGSIVGDNTGEIIVNGSGTIQFNYGAGAAFSKVHYVGSSSPMTTSGDFTCSTSFSVSNIIVSIGSSSITLNGAIDFGVSAFRGSSSAAITIGGSGSVSNLFVMDNSSINNASLLNFTLNRAGVTVPVYYMNIWGTLSATDGTLSCTGTTLKSDATSKSRVGVIGATGAISGNLTIETFKNAGKTGWVNLCASGVTGKTMSNWNSSFAITCPTCPDGSIVNGSAFTSIQAYDETAVTGSASAAGHYIPISAITDAINVNTGYWVFLGNGYPNSTAITIPLTGAVNTKSASGSFNLTLSSSANTEDGWNLISNPYPSPILVSQFISAAGASNIDNTLLAYDPDTDSNVPFTSSGSNSVIPMGQAFMVRALVNNVTVTPDENWKTPTNDNTGVLRSAANGNRNYYFNDFLLDLRPANTNLSVFSQAYFNFKQGATAGFDNGQDAYYIDGAIDPATPRIYSSSNNEMWLRNVLAPVNGTMSIPVTVYSGVAGTYSISPVNLDKLPAGSCVSLLDPSNNQSYNLMNGPAIINITASQPNRQFVLKIVANQVNLTSAVIGPVCKSDKNGIISAKASSNGSWNYKWIDDQSGQVIRTSLSQISGDTLPGVSAGVYRVEVYKNGSCDNGTQHFTVQPVNTEPIAMFSASQNEIFANSNVPVTFNNLSVGADFYLWNFGDGQNANTTHASHVFVNPGDYKIKLTAQNLACPEQSESSMTLKVKAAPVGFAENSTAKETCAFGTDFGATVMLSMNEGDQARIIVSNILGQVLFSGTASHTGEVNINLPQAEKFVIVSVEVNGRKSVNKIVRD